MNIKSYICGASIIISSVFNANAQDVLTLDQCRSRAVEYNKELRKASFGINEAKANQATARTAYLPSLSANSTLMHSPKSQDISTPGYFLPTANSEEEALAGEFSGISDVYNPGMSMSLDHLTFITADITLAQPIYAGGAIRTSNKMADLGVDMSQENYQLKYGDVIEQTDKMFWQIAMMESNLDLVNSYIKMLSDLESRIDKMYELDLVPKSEKLKVSVQKNENEFNLLQVENGLKLAKMYLNQIIGNDLNADITIEYGTLSTDMFDTSNGVNMAELNRKELQLLENQVKLAEYDKKLAKADYLPSLGLGLQYSSYYVNDIYDDWDMTPMISAQLSIPLFAWGKGSKTQKAKQFAIKQHQEQLSHTQDLINLEVLQVETQVQEAFESIMIARKNIAEAQESLEETEVSFEVGLNSTTDILDAQAQLQDAKSKLISSMAQYKTLETTWKKVTGQLTSE